MLKYGFDDARPVLERASAQGDGGACCGRNRGQRVPEASTGCGGAVPCDLDRRLGALRGAPPTAADLERIDARPVRACDEAAEAAMITEIEAAKKDGDTLGGCR